jgi:hypothetical protein
VPRRRRRSPRPSRTGPEAAKTRKDAGPSPHLARAQTPTPGLGVQRSGRPEGGPPVGGADGSRQPEGAPVLARTAACPPGVGRRPPRPSSALGGSGEPVGDASPAYPSRRAADPSPVSHAVHAHWFPVSARGTNTAFCLRDAPGTTRPACLGEGEFTRAPSQCRIRNLRAGARPRSGAAGPHGPGRALALRRPRLSPGRDGRASSRPRR